MTKKQIVEKLSELKMTLPEDEVIIKELISQLTLDIAKENGEKKLNIDLVKTINQCLKYNLKNSGSRKSVFSNYSTEEYEGNKYLSITNGSYLGFLKYQEMFQNVVNLHPETLKEINFPKCRHIVEATNHYKNEEIISLSDIREDLEKALLNFKLGRKTGVKIDIKECVFKFNDSVGLYFNPELVKMGFNLLGNTVKLSYQDAKSLKPIRMENENGDIFILMPVLSNKIWD